MTCVTLDFPSPTRHDIAVRVSNLKNDHVFHLFTNRGPAFVLHLAQRHTLCSSFVPTLVATECFNQNNYYNVS